MTFYDMVVAAGRCAEMRCMPAPKARAARRAAVGRRLPRLAALHSDLCGMGPTARHCEGYAMAEHAWREAAPRLDALAGGIPVQRRSGGAARRALWPAPAARRKGPPAELGPKERRGFGTF